MADIERDFVHLVRLALEGKPDEVAALARRNFTSLVRRRPDLLASVHAALELATASPTRGSATQPLPVDLDSRLELLRRENRPEIVTEPTWPEEVARELEAVQLERRREMELRKAGIPPTRSLLLVGPPGVGKTLAARWLAHRLGRPLLTLDLSAVMSSFLGRTGNNIRVVLDYAKRTTCVLLLDEFDAIAKRRDDAAEIGELKRLVTVLLQEIDEWPIDGLLIAATNHPELLDPAVWRRFDKVVQFPRPTAAQIQEVIVRLLGPNAPDVAASHTATLAALLVGQSFAEVARQVTAARRTAVMRNTTISEALAEIIELLGRSASREHKVHVAEALEQLGRSRRQISATTGLARNTLTKRLGRHDESVRRQKGRL